MKNRYYWVFYKNSERIDGTGESVKGCIKEAKIETMLRGDIDCERIFIGEMYEYIPKIDAVPLLEELEEIAINDVGENSEEWLFSLKEEAIKELEKDLNNTLKSWIYKNHLEIEVPKIECKEYDLVTGKEVK